MRESPPMKRHIKLESFCFLPSFTTFEAVGEHNPYFTQCFPFLSICTSKSGITAAIRTWNLHLLNAGVRLLEDESRAHHQNRINLSVERVSCLGEIVAVEAFTNIQTYLMVNHCFSKVLITQFMVFAWVSWKLYARMHRFSFKCEIWILDCMRRAS